MLIFALHALPIGSLFARLPEIQLQLGLAEDTFGLTLMGIPAGVLTGSTLVGRAIDGFGPRVTLLATLPAFATATVLAAIASGPVSLFVALAIFGVMLSCSNVAINVEADRIESAGTRRIFIKCHGSWGVGFLVVASFAALAIRLGIEPLTHFLALLTVMLTAAATIIWPATDAPVRQQDGAADARRFALPNLGTFLIMGFAVSGIIFDGAIRNWGVIYLRDDFAAAAWVAALALPAMMVTQTAGRFMADTWVGRYGDVRVARALTCISLAGLLVAVLSQTVPLALFGLALIGLGSCTVHPQSLAAAARWGDRPATENVAAFSSLQTAISFAVPPVIGFLAVWVGLRTGLAILLPLAVISFIFARHLAPHE